MRRDRRIGRRSADVGHLVCKPVGTTFRFTQTLQRPRMNYLGIDLHKRESQVAVVDQDGGTQREVRVDNELGGIVPLGNIFGEMSFTNGPATER